MSREIKFRAWQKYHKKMLEVLDIGFEDGEVNYLKVKYPEDTIPNVVIYKKNDKKFWLDDDCIKLMQYTGLKDKNDKEIYEGDILAEHTPSGNNYSVVKFGEIDISVFVYNPKKCTCFYHDFSNFNDNWSEVALGNNLKSIEVIGNIYENPELLEVDE